MNIHPVEAELFFADEQIARHEANSYFLLFCKCT
jgi:hypothetical protein